MPLGYMPASLAKDGTLIKFCPQGVSDAVMALIHPGHGDFSPAADLDNHWDDDHAHHAHHHPHHFDQHDLANTGDHSQHADHGNWSNDCSYGAASSGYDVLADSSLTIHSVACPISLVVSYLQAFPEAGHPDAQPRAPPLLHS